jgi:hypothetical protein
VTNDALIEENCYELKKVSPKSFQNGIRKADPYGMRLRTDADGALSPRQGAFSGRGRRIRPPEMRSGREQLRIY